MIRFQLSALSQNDNYDSNRITATVNDPGGTLEPGSFATSEAVDLPIPPTPSENPPTPTWFLGVSGDLNDACFTVEIIDNNVKPTQTTLINISLSEVIGWAQKNPPLNNSEPLKTNQIWQKGQHGIFGYAEQGSPVAGFEENWIYTITAGVINPEVNP
ncbi:hypothetical protein D3C87_39510 [compost metagenome]